MTAISACHENRLISYQSSSQAPDQPKLGVLFTAQRLPGQPDQLIGRDRQSRRARPGSQHRLGERELSHFLAVAVDLELAPLAAGTDAEVVDLVGAAVVLEGGDGVAGAGVVSCLSLACCGLPLSPFRKCRRVSS